MNAHESQLKRAVSDSGTPSDSGIANVSHDAHKRLKPTPLPEFTRMELEPSFVAYHPTFPKDATTSEEEDAADTTIQKKAKPRKGARKTERRHEDEDNQLYCICQTRYDPTRDMIECDICEAWFHITCVGIPKDSVELIDQFVCPSCEAATGTVTKWNIKCATPTCRQPARRLSKYCSDLCGLRSLLKSGVEELGSNTSSAEANVKKSQNGKVARKSVDPISFAGMDLESAVRSAERPEAVLDFTDSSDERARAQRAMARRLERFRAEHAAMTTRRKDREAFLSLFDSRLKFLAFAVSRWEQLCQATADALIAEGLAPAGLVSSRGEVSNGPNEPTSAVNEVEMREGEDAKPKKGKKKGGGGTRKTFSALLLPEAPCGYDQKLSLSHQEWAGWMTSDDGSSVLKRLCFFDPEPIRPQAIAESLNSLDPGVCLRPRKLCQRHTGWQKIRQVDFQVERASCVSQTFRIEYEERRLASCITKLTERQTFTQWLYDNSEKHKGEEPLGHLVFEEDTAPSPYDVLVPAKSAPENEVKDILAPEPVPKNPEEDETKPTKAKTMGLDIPDEVFALLSRSEQRQILKMANQ